MEGLEQRLDGASWETGRLLESPNGRELSNFPAATQRMISRARLRIFHAIPREPGTWPLAGKADVNRQGRCRGLRASGAKCGFQGLPVENRSPILKFSHEVGMMPRRLPQLNALKAFGAADRHVSLVVSHEATFNPASPTCRAAAEGQCRASELNHRHRESITSEPPWGSMLGKDMDRLSWVRVLR